MSDPFFLWGSSLRHTPLCDLINGHAIVAPSDELETLIDEMNTRIQSKKTAIKIRKAAKKSAKEAAQDVVNFEE